MRKLCRAVLIALLLELTVCQYTSYITLFNRPEQRTAQIYAGGTLNPDGSFTAEDALKLEIPNIDRPLNALKLEITRQNEAGEETEPLTQFFVYVRDEANEDYYVLPERQLLKSVPESSYMMLHSTGSCKSLVLSFAVSPGETVKVEELVLNPRIPLSISWIRLFLFTLAFCFVFFAGVFSGKPSACCRACYSPDNRKQRRVTIAVCILQAGLFTGAVFLNPAFTKAEWEHHMQYQRLAEAFAKGQLYLEEEPPAALASMENPYDYAMRQKVLESTGESCLWDTAYYNGKYYVYFGVVPVILFYLPWYLLTGTAFPTWLGILLTGFLLIGAVYFLLHSLIQKYFKGKVPYGGFLLSMILMVNGCGALSIMRRPDFYSLPILLGVTLSILGIGFWISSLKEEGVTAWKLVAGCLCMALVAGCRPQLLLGSFLIFPIYWRAVFQKRQLFSRGSLGRTAFAVLAYVSVGAFLMLYNYKRFGSPFDFGANYNLTTNDMTRRGFELGRLPFAVFTSLLQPPNISARFPYLQPALQWTSYMGKTISEGTFGGFLPVNLMAASGLLLLGKRRWFSDRIPYLLAALSAALGLLIVCIDAQAAGVLLRYYSDFGWLFYLAGLAAWFAAWEYSKNSPQLRRLLYTGQNLAFAVGMAFCFLLLFTDNEYRLADTNPSLFYTFYYQLAFWT